MSKIRAIPRICGDRFVASTYITRLYTSVDDDHILFGFIGYLLKINGLKILRIYGQEIEQKVFPVPDKITEFRSKLVAAQLKADEDLKNVSLHHVIRSNECPFAEELRDYDQEFTELFRLKMNASRQTIRRFNKVKFSRF